MVMNASSEPPDVLWKTRVCSLLSYTAWWLLPCAMHGTFIIHKKSTVNNYKSTKIPDITIDMQFIKFVPGSEESQQEYYYKRIAAKEQWQHLFNTFL